MYSKKIVFCAILALALFLGMNISGSIPSAFAKECYRQGDCKTDCIADPAEGYGGYSKCKEIYKRAVRDDACGIGKKNTMPCGQLWIGGALCPNSAGSCGSDSYSNGTC
jgi:hypothetical protein